MKNIKFNGTQNSCIDRGGLSLLLVSCFVEDREAQVSVDIQPSKVFDNEFLIAHRGAVDFPENTAIAVEAAIRRGFKAIEVDVARTRDGVFVLSHDETIDRCSNGSGIIAEMTYEDIRKYDFGGTPIPELREILLMCKKHDVLLELDLADDDRFPIENVYDLFMMVKECQMLSNTIFCAAVEKLDSLASISNTINISVSGITTLQKAQEALYLKEKSMSINFSVATWNLVPHIVDFAHENGVKIKTWTCTTFEMSQECKERGADYIIVEADFPYWL